MIVLNGRGKKEKDDLTVLSTTGKSVVDYVIIQAEHFTKYNSFEVTPVIDILERFDILPDSSIPDHSLVSWQCKVPQHKVDNTTVIPKHKITYRRQLDKPVFKSERALQSLEDLISDLDTIRSVNDTKLKENKLINNYNTFYSLIEKEYYRPASHHSGSRKPWWNHELTSHRKQLRKAHKAWRIETNIEIRTKLWKDFKQEQKNFNRHTRKVKRTYINHRQTYFQLTKATNPKKFWKAYDQIRISNGKASNQELPKAVLNGDGSLVFNKEEVLKVWQRHFTNVLKPADTKPRGNYDTDSSTYDEALNRPISLEEVQSAITQLQEDKAPGPDSICPSVRKDDRMCQYLHRLFQNCFENGVVPQAWLDSTIQLIIAIKEKETNTIPITIEG